MDVVVKILKLGMMFIEVFFLEVMIMKKCKYDKLVWFYVVCIDKEFIYIVIELMFKGSFFDYLWGDEVDFFKFM